MGIFQQSNVVSCFHSNLVGLIYLVRKSLNPSAEVSKRAGNTTATPPASHIAILQPHSITKKRQLQGHSRGRGRGRTHVLHVLVEISLITRPLLQTVGDGALFLELRLLRANHSFISAKGDWLKMYIYIYIYPINHCIDHNPRLVRPLFTPYLKCRYRPCLAILRSKKYPNDNRQVVPSSTG